MTFIFAWIASLSFGLETLTGKIVSKYSVPNEWLFSFILSFFSFLLTLPVALINGVSIPSHWPSILIAGLFSSFVQILFILSLKKLDITVFTPLFALRNVFTILLAWKVVGEILSPRQIVISTIIIILIPLSSYNEKLKLKSFLQKGIISAILLMLTLTFESLFINIAIAKNDYWTVALITSAATFIYPLLALPLYIKDLKNTSFTNYIGILAMSVFEAIGAGASVKAMGGNVTITTIIISLPISFILALLITILKPGFIEKNNTRTYMIRIIAVTIMVSLAIFLTL